MNSYVPRPGAFSRAVSSSARRFAPAQGASLECLTARVRPNAHGNDRQILSDEDRFLRVKTIAAETEVSEKTVRRWIDLLGLPSQKLGGLRVVRKRDLLAFFENLKNRK